MLVFLVLLQDIGPPLLIGNAADLVIIHNGALAVLQTILSVHHNLADTVKVLGRTYHCLKKYIYVRQIVHMIIIMYRVFFFLWIQSGGCKSAMLRSFMLFL